MGDGDKWHVSTGGAPIGPLTETQVIEMIRGGLKIVSVGRDGGDEWVPPAAHPPFAAALGVEPITQAMKPEARTGLKLQVMAVGTILTVGLVAVAYSVLNDRATTRSRETVSMASAKAERTRAEIAKAWRDFDALPYKAKPAAIQTSLENADIARKVPEPFQRELLRDNLAMARGRFASLIRPESRATGESNEILVPARDPTTCRVWGSMWVGDEETLAGLETLGYEKISCPDHAWDVGELRRTCFLYWDQSSTHEGDDTVIVWNTLEKFEQGQILGRQRGEEASMRFVAFVSAGASMMVPGVHFNIVARGNGWARVESHDRKTSGFVDPEACHREAQGQPRRK